MWDFPNPGWPQSPLRKQRKGIFNRLKLDRLGFSWGHFFSVGWEKWEMKANIDWKQVLHIWICSMPLRLVLFFPFGERVNKLEDELLLVGTQ